MSKKNIINKYNKKKILEYKKKSIRIYLKKKIKESTSLIIKWKFIVKLQSLPRDSSATRFNRRCFLTSSPRAYYRDFGISRHILYEMLNAGLLPGTLRSSW
uniref:Ribosomal protein S14 n=1 Tax=Cynomorium coccineum TaxID=51503 RepID=A0A1B1FBV9_9MAGN|nr:ribosomal protein S14 [Cynomorium coccineum]